MTRIGFQIIFLMTVAVTCRLTGSSSAANKCQGSNGKLKYLWGDALTDSPDCIGPEHKPYPRQMISRTIKMGAWGGNARTGRNMKTVDPFDMQRGLINMYKRMKNDPHTTGNRTRRAMDNTCNSGGRLCRTRYNTTAPMYGVSLTSGQPVTIVQKFPDLLQQVVFEVCESRECGVIRGECTQTYVPYLFLVLPLGPVTLTGQDYVLVESGCVCKPTGLTGYTNEGNPIAGIP